jgi:hypothetical protein
LLPLLAVMRLSQLAPANTSLAADARAEAGETCASERALDSTWETPL